MERYVVLEKEIGETPLVCAENWRKENPEYKDLPLAYAGRLDPMASGKLLILIGDECKKQTDYHGLDKEYEFSVLFGVSSDTGDVLGRLQAESEVPAPEKATLEKIASSLTGEITLPYPHFSSKTVQGKPLHTWILEGRLDEIEIPTVSSTIYNLTFNTLETKSRKDVAAEATSKINTIPPVIDPRKVIGNDFRRTDVRADWSEFTNNDSLPNEYLIASFTCIATSGTYMRSLAEQIAKQAGTTGLAWHIHRSQIGTYARSKNTFTNEY